MKKTLTTTIRFYQKHISPHTPAVCKFQPTCSEYARIAIERFGAAEGSALAAWRLIRCSPLTSGGYDPVPEIKEYL